MEGHWEGRDGASLTNIEVSETSARPQAPFVAVQGKKVLSLTCLNVYTFSSPRYFYETLLGRVLLAVLLTPLSSWEVSRERHPRPFTFQYFSRCFSDTSVRTLLSSSIFAHALYISYMSGVTRTRVLCSSGSFAMRARLRCTRARLSFASRKHRGYYACMPGFDVAEGWGIFFFTWIPRGSALASLNTEHLAFFFKLYNSPVRFCGVFVTARLSEGTECTDFINIVIVKYF